MELSLIMTGKGGEALQKNFEPKPMLQIKIQASSRLQGIIRDSNPALPPCIMCVQYCGGAQCRGVFSTLGDVTRTAGGYLKYHGEFQYRGGYEYACRGYLEYPEGVQYRGGYHEYRENILNTVGMLSIMGSHRDTCGRYRKYHGVFSTWRYPNNKRFIPLTVLITPTVLKESPIVLRISPQC